MEEVLSKATYSVFSHGFNFHAMHELIQYNLN